jgi:hypothetical protein
LARKAQWAGQEAMTVCSLLANGSKNFSLPGFWEQESKPTSAKATDEFVENSNK